VSVRGGSDGPRWLCLREPYAVLRVRGGSAKFRRSFEDDLLSQNDLTRVVQMREVCRADCSRREDPVKSPRISVVPEHTLLRGEVAWRSARPRFDWVTRPSRAGIWRNPRVAKLSVRRDFQRLRLVSVMLYARAALEQMGNSTRRFSAASVVLGIGLTRRLSAELRPLGSRCATSFAPRSSGRRSGPGRGGS
jgi:hypothetical protein